MRFQNVFFLFGLAVLAIMISQLDFAAVWAGLSRAGYWAVAVVALWGPLYALNTAAWYVIIRALAPKGSGGEVSFAWLYKITVSGFALNYATPGGLMGGEPYRIMELSRKIGTERASSSVILYAMTHIFSHFWFWLISALLFALTQPVDTPMAILLGAIALFAAAAIRLFLKGYKHGLAAKAMQWCTRLPIARRRAEAFVEKNSARLADIDRQIAALHGQNPKAFFSAVGLELACRLASAMEVWFVLLVMQPDATYMQALLTLAFTSLLANLLFFIPLQMGGREGGFLLSAKGLAMTADAGILVGIVVRIRELIWTAVGLLLIKVGGGVVSKQVDK